MVFVLSPAGQHQELEKKPAPEQPNLTSAMQAVQCWLPSTVPASGLDGHQRTDMPAPEQRLNLAMHQAVRCWLPWCLGLLLGCFIGVPRGALRTRDVQRPCGSPFLGTTALPSVDHVLSPARNART